MSSGTSPGMVAVKIARRKATSVTARLEAAAREIAEEGAARARAAGLAAEADVPQGESAGDIGAALLDAAEQHDADLVVVARRGISLFRAVVLGSVSDAAVRDGRRPVLVVPAAD